MADRDFLELSEEFDQILRQELSVEPSPTFAVRVRERAAEQHRTPWWSARWIPALGSLATVASLAMAVTVPAITRWTSAPLPPSPPVLRVANVQHPFLDAATPSQERLSRSPRLDNRPSAPVQSVAWSQVMVDGRQLAALTTLFRMMEQGTVSGDSFAATVPVSLEPIVDHIGEITVVPVLVNVIPSGGVLPNDER